MTRDPARIFWETASQRLAARINWAGWLERFAPLAFGWCSLAAIAGYAARRTGGPAEVVWGGAVLILAALAGWAAWRGRARRFGVVEARVMIESALRLDTRLSAAAEGRADWPAPRASLPVFVRWRSLAAPGWLGAAAGMLALGAWAPVAGNSVSPRPPVEKAPAIAQVEAILQALAERQIADPGSLDQLSAEVRELADRPAEEQYTHSALEAADALNERTLSAVRELARHYDAGANALAPLESPGEGREGEQLAAARDQLASALQGLRGGRIAGSPELTAAMEAARDALSRLTPEQIQQLRQQFQQAGARGRGIAGAARQNAAIARPGGAAGEGEGWGPGNGGVDRGRGDAPLMLNSQLSPENAGQLEGMNSEDFSRLSLGQLAGTENGGAHRVDKNRPADATGGGAVTLVPASGEAAWIDRLSPADRHTLRDFFK